MINLGRFVEDLILPHFWQRVPRHQIRQHRVFGLPYLIDDHPGIFNAEFPGNRFDFPPPGPARGSAVDGQLMLLRRAPVDDESEIIRRGEAPPRSRIVSYMGQALNVNLFFSIG